jgi:DNA-binding XRE family transcriptional regulator
MVNNSLFWDKKITVEEVKKILKDDSNSRFIEFAALLLSRTNDPRQVFANYISKILFCRNWRKIKTQMRKNKWSDNKIIFWDTIHGVVVKDIDKNELKAKKTISVSQEIKPIGDKIREARKRVRWTQGELANKSKISQQTISLVENGYTNISLSVLKKIADALGLEIRIDYKEDKSSKAQTYSYQ